MVLSRNLLFSLALFLMGALLMSANASAAAPAVTGPDCVGSLKGNATSAAARAEHNKHCAPPAVLTNFTISGCVATITGPGVEDYNLYGIVTDQVTMDWASTGTWWALIERSPGQVRITDLTGMSFCDNTPRYVNLLKEDGMGGYTGYTTIYPA